MKKNLVLAAVALSLLTLVGCGQEGKGNVAWREAQKYEEGSSPRLMKQKEAYLAYKAAYDKAVANSKVSTKLLNNYLTNGHTWVKHGISVEQVYKRMAPVQQALPELWEFVEYVILIRC